jgi:Dyp-type peroxidase family
MALTLEESRVSNNQQFSEMLNDLQANILKHHGRDFAFHLFLTIKSGKSIEARNWIADFATAKVTSTAKQLIDSKIKKVNDIDGGTVYTFSLTSFGYDKLGIQTTLKPENQAFQDGMKQRSNLLADNPTDWENEFQNNIDILIIVGNSNEEIAYERKNNLISQLSSNFDIVKVQKGQVLKNEHGVGIEHFGYADGISQPIFFEKEVNEQSNHTIWKDEAKLKLALVKDKGGKFQDSYGSYFVFRKLEQNVKAFKEAEENLQKVRDSSGNDNDDLAGAMVVGRFEDGTEVVNSSVERGITNPKDLKNDFDYSNDSNASKCPFHSHIRITNPRADIGNTNIDSFVKRKRIVRRGIPFNEIGRIGTQGLPENGVGLLFMCYQSDIEAQFEFIQHEWVNLGNFAGRLVGQDGIIGQGQNDFQKQLPEQWGVSGNLNNCHFSNPKSGFVSMKGGEYFYTPSISFLKSLSNSLNLI